MNGIPSGCTGRGRGIRGGELGVGRSRGRGITEGAVRDNVPGLKSLSLNGTGSNHTEDVRSALTTVTSKPRNEPEVTRVLEKWLDLAENSEDIGEAVAKSVCEMMGHAEYGDLIRANVMTRIYTMHEECRLHKVKSLSILTSRFSFTGYMYFIQRDPHTNKRIVIYDTPMLLYMKELLTHKLSEECVKVLTKQLSVNGIALNFNPDNRADLESIFVSIRKALLSTQDPAIKAYLLFLCDLQSRDYHALSSPVLKFYADILPEATVKSYRPLEIDVKLYGN